VVDIKMKNINIGIQLYSVRDEIKEYGLDTVLEALKEAGCNAVEFAGFYGLTPEQMKAKLEKYGLRPLSAHIRLDEIIDNLPYIDALGISMVYIPGHPIEKMTGENYQSFIEEIKKVKAELDTRGVRFGYHNHAKEFEGGMDLLDDMTRDVEGFSAELDIYWAVAAGHKPTSLIEKYGKRLTALHIKDMDSRANPKNPGEYPNAVIGEGQCDAEAAFRKAHESGVDTYILEVEYYPCDYKDYIKRSVENINKFIKNI
jgi:sugar phosphate isomerase/epimerase